MRATGSTPLKVKFGFPEETFARNPRPKTETQEARGQDVGDLGKPIFGAHAGQVSRV